MGDVGVMLLVASFWLGLILVLAGVVVAFVGVVRRSSGAGWVAGWLFLVGAILALVSGTIIWQALGEIGS